MPLKSLKHVLNLGPYTPLKGIQGPYIPYIPSKVIHRPRRGACERRILRLPINKHHNLFHLPLETHMLSRS